MSEVRFLFAVPVFWGSSNGRTSSFGLDNGGSSPSPQASLNRHDFRADNDRKIMANPWFRLYSEFATDPKVQMLSESDQRRFIMLLCLRCSNEDETLQDEEIAFQLRISNDEWQSTKSLFMDKKLINEHGQPLAWNERQFRSDSSTARVREHRKKKKQECNVTVTTPDTDTDTDNNNSNELLSGKPDDVYDCKNPGALKLGLKTHVLFRPGEVRKESCKTVIEKIFKKLNQQTGASYECFRGGELTANGKTVYHLLKRYYPFEIAMVIEQKAIDWGDDEKMAEYLRPKTLFAKSNFENYLGSLPIEEGMT